MDIADLLTPHTVFAKVRAGSKKALLEILAEKAAKAVKLPAVLVHETILERERLNTTGVGQGVAIPHGRFKALDRMAGVFARLEEPVDFESIDGLPVDIVFLLLAPESAGADHLKALARVSRLLRNQAICEKLRASRDEAALFAILTEPAATGVAAA
jgi:PTS system nitrogen regulatory IIA component